MPTMETRLTRASMRHEFWQIDSTRLNSWGMGCVVSSLWHLTFPHSCTLHCMVAALSGDDCPLCCTVALLQLYGCTSVAIFRESLVHRARTSCGGGWLTCAAQYPSPATRMVCACLRICVIRWGMAPAASGSSASKGRKQKAVCVGGPSTMRTRLTLMTRHCPCQ